MSEDVIRLRGCRVHNLKNIDLDIPREKLIAVCGVSGAGKTSLVVDTLYAEGQRRYIESFSTYTRQFLDRFDKPDYDAIDGLPPALAVRRGTTSRSNRSTVGSASETIDYLRLLFAKLAKPICYQCNQPVQEHSPQTAARLIESLVNQKIMIAFEVSWSDVQQRALALADLQADGFLRLICNSQEIRLSDSDRTQLAQQLPRSGSAWVVVDRVRGGESSRSSESLESAFDLGFGEAVLFVSPLASSDAASIELPPHSEMQVDGTNWLFFRLADRLMCPTCNIEFPAAQPKLFSYNSPLGACPTCEGFGDTNEVDMNLVVPDPTKSLLEGAIVPWSMPAYSEPLDELMDIADAIGLPLDVPFKQLTKKQLQFIIEGVPKLGFTGLNGFFAWLERKKYKMHVRVFLSRWRSYRTCATCQGQRLSPLALSYKLDGHDFAELCQMQASELTVLLNSMPFTDRQRELANIPLNNTLTRLLYLQDVGLGYLSLDRTLRTLSGGEAQRTALAAVLGSSLVNMLYILDEPSAGLHAEDVTRLARSIQTLAGRGNSVVMIEHDETLIRGSEWLIEMGPAAGNAGGQIVCSSAMGSLKPGQSLTADYMRGTKRIAAPTARRQPTHWLKLRGCTGNNLANIDVDFPLQTLCTVTGVSGSGKSSLVHDTLYHGLSQAASGSKKKAGLPFASLTGDARIDDCILVDQLPIGRSPRSNPVTYIKAFDEIRNAFASTIEARTHNYSSGHFSFNSAKGRCEHCSGDGSLQIDMQFLADVSMTCPACNGTRYRKEVLRILYRGKSIADVLAMTADDCLAFFRGAPKIQDKLSVLSDVGLGYIQLGQAANTLSAGEAQRLKLAAQLAVETRKKCLFILDEPSTGLHPDDLVQLMKCFNTLLEKGHSLILVEHSMHIIAASDYIIDLGPGPAQMGGQVVACGTPEEIAADPHSCTGKHLQGHLT